MKKVGIVVDNYKLDKFKEELIKQGFPDFSTNPFTAATTSIRVNVEDDQVTKVHQLCQRLEFNFQHRN